jgi:hypothetical protein
MRPWQAIGLVAIVVLVIIVVLVFVLPMRTEAPSSTPVVRPSPSATATSPPTTAPPPSPAPSVSPSGPATSAEQLADRLADALEASDFERLGTLMDPAGFIYQQNATGGSTPIPPDQAIDRIKRGTTDGKLRVTVQRRPLLPRGQFQPDGDLFITSTWLQHDGKPTQRVDLLLKNESGQWYWRSALFGVP